MTENESNGTLSASVLTGESCRGEYVSPELDKENSELGEEAATFHKRLIQMKNRKCAYSKLAENEDFSDIRVDQNVENMIEENDESIIEDNCPIKSENSPQSYFKVAQVSEDTSCDFDEPKTSLNECEDGGPTSEESLKDLHSSTEQPERSTLSLDAGIHGIEVRSVSRFHCCQKIGNCTILCPPLYRATGIGVIGPNWSGPIVTLMLIWGLTVFFYFKAATQQGERLMEGNMNLKQFLCTFFATLSALLLFFVACADPGVVTESNQGQYYPLRVDDQVLQRRRWCDICGVYQPMKTVHCSECNLCFAGYDHHCPWMGTCVAKKNFKAFICFNVTWLVYLVYAVIFIGANLITLKT